MLNLTFTHCYQSMPEHLEPLDAADEENDDDPTPEELAQMQRATPADAAAVNALILKSCTDRWRKVAMVVGTSLKEFDAKFPHLPHVYMPVRIIEMEHSGALEVQGDPMAMRFSEVRLAGDKP
ncbi:MAG: hypothetical protein H3C29_01355 [Simplicispira suum]|uniref:DUF3658 domain-containing protein n=1 Tax=Simplicispira suum TaxID=2109915 RepID=UPI001C6AB599|nr:DUF3658 domain-containing protein [Simplicispira suum]MBW7831840.1 hypothetical protein [Simplicispira suum]